MTEKEIWMEKLMKYVEEMQKEWINICRPQFQEYYLVEMMLISKYYWLIKWLVENDKTDDYKIRKAREEIWNVIDYFYKIPWAAEKSLLMLLSISDTPIDDLISYLK